MTYTFKDFGQRAEESPLSIRTIINGTELDSQLTADGFSFRTLRVNGRGKISNALDADSIYGRQGGLFRNSSLDPRSIVVTAMVRADSNAAYRRGMTNINLLLYSRDIHAIRFTDEPAYTFYGAVQRVEDGDESSNTQIVEIEFVCYDPFKYSTTKTHTTTNATRLDIDSQLRIVPEEITITFPNSTDARDFSLNNTTTGRRIRFQQDGTASGKTIKIRQKDDYIGYTESVNHIGGLNVTYSHFDEFDVISGDRLVVTPKPESIVIKYKGASL